MIIKTAGPPVPPSRYHEHEFSVITVGTGCPIPNMNRASACTVIQKNNQYYVIDTGNGTTNAFIKAQMAYSQISAIMFSHLHLDHTSDYFDIMTNRYMTGGKEMELIGPPRTGKIHKMMLDFWYDDLVYRRYRGYERGIRDIGMFEGIKINEIMGGDFFELDDIKISTCECTHTQYNIAYRFDVEGKSIVVSGDTSYDIRLVDLAKDCDILVIDGSINKVGTKEGIAFTDKSIEKPQPKYVHSGNFEVNPHFTYAECLQTIVESNPKKVVLTHFDPKPIEKDPVITDLKKLGYAGEIIFAIDGLEIIPN